MLAYSGSKNIYSYIYMLTVRGKSSYVASDILLLSTNHNINWFVVYKTVGNAYTDLLFYPNNYETMLVLYTSDSALAVGVSIVYVMDDRIYLLAEVYKKVCIYFINIITNLLI